MKIALALILCVLMLIPLAACGGEESTPSETEPTESAPAAAGTVLTLVPDVDADTVVHKEQFDAAQEYYELKLEQAGFAGASVNVSDYERIVIRLGETITEEQAEELTYIPGLFFRHDDVILMGSSDVDSVAVGYSNIGYSDDGTLEVGEPFIQITMTKEGKRKLADVTEAYIHEQIGLCLDDTVLYSPSVVAPITDGKLALYGVGDIEETTALCTMLSAAALDFRFIVTSENVK